MASKQTYKRLYKDGQYLLLVEKGTKKETIGVTTEFNGDQFILSNSPDFDGTSIPVKSRLGFRFSIRISNKARPQEWTKESILVNLYVDSVTPITKTAGLRVLVRERLLFPLVLDGAYDVSFNKKTNNFNFGCGAVAVTDEELKIFIKFLSIFNEKESTTLSDILHEISQQENLSESLPILKKELSTIKNLLKHPDYLAALSGAGKKTKK